MSEAYKKYIKTSKGKEARKRANQKYRLSNKGKALKSINSNKYNRSFKGKPTRMYIAIRHRLKYKPTYKNRTLLFTREEFIEWILSNLDYIRIHREWVESDYQLKLCPSVDRINNSGNYSLDNIQIITQSENSKKFTK